MTKYTETFGWAIARLKEGHKVARAGWNGKDMHICLMPDMDVPADKVSDRTKKFVPAGKDLKVGGYIAMWTAQGVFQPGWLCSQPDMLSEDWAIVD